MKNILSEVYIYRGRKVLLNYFEFPSVHVGYIKGLKTVKDSVMALEVYISRKLTKKNVK